MHPIFLRVYSKKYLKLIRKADKKDSTVILTVLSLILTNL